MQIKDGREAWCVVLYSCEHKILSFSQASNIDITIFLLALFLAGPFPKVIQTANLTDSNPLFFVLNFVCLFCLSGYVSV